MTPAQFQRFFGSRGGVSTPVSPPTPQPDGTKYWSDPATWYGSVPGTGDAVNIGAGQDITYDVTSSMPPSLQEIVIDGGILRYSDRVDTFMRTRNVTIRNGGQLLCGTDSTANTRRHVRTMIGPGVAGRVRGYSYIGNTPTGNNGQSNDAINGQPGYARGLLLSTGGKYKVNAARPPDVKAHLQGNHAAGATSLHLDKGVYWKAGGSILIPPTGPYNAARRTERFTVAADTNGSSVVQITGSGLGYFRWGLLQYPTDSYTISLTQDPFTLKSAGGARATPLVPNVIDQRAKVIYLDRGYSVEGDNDSTYQDEGLGGHEMYMDLDIEVTLHGVQYLRCGQAAMRARYATHFHMNGYRFNTTLGHFDTFATNPVTGLSDGKFAPGQAEVEDCVVLDSQNRGFNGHGCIGVKWKNCVVDNVKSYGFMTENGSEMFNTWDSCHATRCEDPGEGLRTQAHEGQSPAGWWISNVKNYFINTMGPGWDNSGADSYIGVTLNLTGQRDGYPGGCFGESAQLAVFPGCQAPLQWDGFLHHATANLGRQAFNFLADEQGNLTGSGDNFPANTLGTPIDRNSQQDLILATLFRGDKFWFCAGGAYGNNRNHPIYESWTICDIPGKGFTGNTAAGEQQSLLGVERTLNNSDGDFTDWLLTIGYHGSLIPQDSTIIGYGAAGLPAPSNHGDRFDGILVMNAMTTTEDLYLDAFVAYSDFMTNLCSDPNGGPLVHLTPRPSLQNVAPFSQWAGTTDLAPNAHWTAGNYDPPGGSATLAYKDKFGSIFKKGANRWGLVDHPFVTTGCAGLVDVPNRSGQYIGMASTTSDICGCSSVLSSILDEAGGDIRTHKFLAQRVSPTDLSDIAGASMLINNAPGREGASGITFPIVSGGWVRLKDATSSSGFIGTIQTFELQTTRAENDVNLVGIGFAYPNAKAFQPWWYSPTAGSLPIPEVSSKAALLSASAISFWRDTATQTCWVKGVIRPVGMPQFYTNPQGTTYRPPGYTHMGIWFYMPA